jgi:peptidyl-tRNA hydrolase
MVIFKYLDEGGKLTPQYSDCGTPVAYLNREVAIDPATGEQILVPATPETLARYERHDLMFKWVKSSFRKVVLRADDKEWEKVKACPDLTFVTVRDAGLTEVAAGSETVLGIWPMLKSQAPKVLKKLQVLK